MDLSTYLASHPDLSDADAASSYNAMPPVTAAPIPLDLLGPLLRKVGLMAILKAIAADTNQDARVRAAIGDFLDQLSDQRQKNLDTTDPIIATRAAAVLAGLAPIATANGIDAAAVVSAIYSLGGGLKYPGPVTADDVTAARADIARRAAVQSLREAWAQLYNDGVTAIDAGEASGTLPTLEQLRAG